MGIPDIEKCTNFTYDQHKIFPGFKTIADVNK